MPNNDTKVNPNDIYSGDEMPSKDELITNIHEDNSFGSENILSQDNNENNESVIDQKDINLKSEDDEPTDDESEENSDKKYSSSSSETTYATMADIQYQNNESKGIFVYNFTCEGFSHIKSGKPCQDYSDKKRFEINNFDDNIIIALSDGHGSDTYFRSDRGSKFAVEIAVEKITKFLEDYDYNKFIEEFEDNGYDVKNELENNIVKIGITNTNSENKLKKEIDKHLRQRLTESIYSSWLDKIKEDAENSELNETETKDVPESYLEKYKNGEEIEKAYGATLMACVRTKDYWFGRQIGDGKCMAFDRKGKWSEPIPWDDNCVANITTSLCSEDANNSFRFCFGSFNTCPAAIFIGSDGMDDSFDTVSDLSEFYSKVISTTVEEGEKEIKLQIENYLPELSRVRSKDDMSLAFWMDKGAIKNMLPNIYKTRIENLEKNIETEKVLSETKKREIETISKNEKHLEEQEIKAKEKIEEIKTIKNELKEQAVVHKGKAGICNVQIEKHKNSQNCLKKNDGGSEKTFRRFSIYVE